MLSNTTEIGTALRPLRRVTRAARTAVSPRTPRPATHRTRLPGQAPLVPALAASLLAGFLLGGPEAAQAQTPNNAPTVANPIPDQAAAVGAAFSYQFPDTTFTDEDTGDTLSYAATKADGTMLPTWLGFTAGTRTFAGTPQAADTGTVSVKVTATDSNSGSVSDEFDITVRDPNAGICPRTETVRDALLARPASPIAPLSPTPISPPSPAR